MRLVQVLALLPLVRPHPRHRPLCPNTAEYSGRGAGAARQCPRCEEAATSRGSQLVLTTVPRGQLGNHLHSYALLHALAALGPHQLQPAARFLVSSETAAFLRTYFRPEPLLVGGLDTLCLCKSHLGVYSRPWKWRTWRAEQGSDYVKDLSRLRPEPGEESVIVVLWPDQGFLYEEGQLGLELLEQTSGRLVRSLVLRSSLVNTAAARLRSSIKTWFRHNKKKVARLGLAWPGNVTVVGVHHRRGDHLKYEAVHGIPHITAAYLGPAMDTFRNQYNNAVVFLYVSDDKDWIRSRLARDRDLVVATSEAADPVLAAGEDLALLAACDHTILTRGTFSSWAARLCGGKVVRPCMFPQSATEQEVARRGEARWPDNPLHSRWQTSLWRSCA